MTDTVTDELVEIAAKALFARSEKPVGRDVDSCWPEFAEVVRDRFRQQARAALSAALPLVVAGERERAAEIVEAMHAEPTDRGTIIHYTHKMRRDIVAAIRADTGGE